MLTVIIIPKDNSSTNRSFEHNGIPSHCRINKDIRPPLEAGHKTAFYTLSTSVCSCWYEILFWPRVRSTGGPSDNASSIWSRLYHSMSFWFQTSEIIR